MPKSTSEALLASFGPSGFPKVVPEEYAPSWQAYSETTAIPSDPKTRIFQVLGFLHLMRQSGVKAQCNPYAAYDSLLKESISEYAKILVRELRSCRALDLFRIHKTYTGLEVAGDGSVVAVFNVCCVPRRNEHLDATLAKAEGSLYRGQLPVFLAERWRTMSARSKAVHPKSALPKMPQLLKSHSLVGSLPLHVEDNCSFHASRAADGYLVFKFIARIGLPRPSWLPPGKYRKVVHSKWASAFKSL